MSNASEQQQTAMWAESELPPRAVGAAGERGRAQGPAAFPAGEPPADDVAGGGRGALGGARPPGAGDLGNDRAAGPDALHRGGAGGGGRGGAYADDPRLLISLWIYAYSEKVSSAREVTRRCAYHPAYQWLTGCEIINYHTLSDFRVDHQEALDKLFAQLLAVLSSEGLISLEQVVHDGTKVKAAASGKSFHREKTLRAHLEAAQQRVRAMGDPRQDARGPGAERARERAAREKVEKLEQALEELKKVQAAPKARAEKSERRVSETDPEARVMKQSDGGHAPSHNVQISTDVAHSIIVGASVTQECQ